MLKPRSLAASLAVSASACLALTASAAAALAPVQAKQAAKTRAASNQTAPFLWSNATVYFLLTDRFYNGKPANDLAYGRAADAAPLRGFMGGDLAGISKKLRAGYFQKLGVNAIWLTPLLEQIHGATDEGTGKSYGFHGYWAKDFTRLDANFGTEDELREFIRLAHQQGIRVLFDVVMNHTGPQTASDPLWPEQWVRLDPVCTYQDVASTVSCALVKGLPDIKTETMTAVDLPPALAAKWRAEGRYEQEVRELDEFFARTGYPRAPRYYLMKWQSDWVRRFGIDGFRADTVKHTEPELWRELKQVATAAHQQWKRQHAAELQFDEPFYMTAEVYNYSIAQGLNFTMDGGSQINYFDYGFDSLINFGFKQDAKADYEGLFASYSQRLAGEFRGHGVLNYLSSHDDDQPFDATRSKTYEAANKLLLSPGSAQIYYGDETARTLQAATAQGDAKLRAPMNWQDLVPTSPNYRATQALLRHWQLLGRFRQAHLAIGAGRHQQLASQPYTFARLYQQSDRHDKVVVALDLSPGQSVEIQVAPVFADGVTVRDAYSGIQGKVRQGKFTLAKPGRVALLEQVQP